jgi:nucleotide-binding universal stress UspA family protein
MSTAAAPGRIVVGVDGSHHADKALAWALAEARLRGCTLEVLYAFPALVTYAGTTAHEYYPAVEREAEQIFERALAAMPEHSDVVVERKLVPGNPAGHLVEASRGATLLVVGSRGLGGFRGMLIGSVSIHCVHHAFCPVVVIRQDDPA